VGRRSILASGSTRKEERITMIRTMVVDDSPYMRTLISDMLSADPDIAVVDTAKDGREAVEKASRVRPDVITMDLEMPVWDGLTTIKQLMIQYPVPVVVLTAHSRENADIVLECLDVGAVGFVLKPSGELSMDKNTIKARLIEAVKSASTTDPGRIGLLAKRKQEKVNQRPVASNKIIVIGASTGGPQTIELIIASLPRSMSDPVIVVQHMPNRSFSESFTQRLAKICAVHVKIAEDNETIEPGRIYVAPGGFELIITCDHDGKPEIFLKESALKSSGPSVDLTMMSAAAIYGDNTMGIILSGMGSDGLKGMKAIKDSGGRTIAQNETALLFGMPKEVIDAGHAEKVLPVSRIIEEMIKREHKDCLVFCS
jgi:two-component system chemotaxis response regulator CheB